MKAKKSARSQGRTMLLAPSTSLLLEAGYRRRVPLASSLAWIHEMLETDAAYVHRRMFGCDAAYLDGLICLVTATKDEPWNGLLVCTSKDRQASLTAQWPALRPHDTLSKWLYLSQDDAAFETLARQLSRAVLARDVRIGVEPKSKRRKQTGRAVHRKTCARRKAH